MSQTGKQFRRRDPYWYAGAVETMEPRFSIDGSLGRLARWLRLLGYDAAGEPGEPFARALQRARAERRILLTRSRELERLGRTPPAAGWILVTAPDLAGQLLQVDRQHPILDAARPFRRCPICNRPLEQIEASHARRRVPPFVARTQERFRLCPSCDRIFWEATHAEAITRFLRRVASFRGTDRSDAPAAEEDAGPDSSDPAP